MTRKRIIRTAMLVVVLLGAVALWPNVEAILTLGAAAVLLLGYVAINGWAQRRRRRGEEASTFDARRTTIPFTGGSGGGAGP